jgi:hypothetical protein
MYVGGIQNTMESVKGSSGTYLGLVGTDNSGGSFVSLDPTYILHALTGTVCVPSRSLSFSLYCAGRQIGQYQQQSLTEVEMEG